jgi:hypothetical protein
LLVLGLALLVKSGEWLVTAAVRIEHFPAYLAWPIAELALKHTAVFSR